MKIFNIVLTVIISGMMTMTGSMKLFNSKEKLLEDPMMGWVTDFSQLILWMIGGLEYLAVLGLILPFFTKIPKLA